MYLRYYNDFNRIFFTENGIFTINNSPLSPHLAPFDFYLFKKLHFTMKGKCYADIEDIQMSTSIILNIICTDFE